MILSPLIEGFARAHDMAFERQESSPGQVTWALRDSTGSVETGRSDMSLTNSVEGFADLLANQADIALSTRPLSQDELALARDAGLGQQTNRRAELWVRSN